MKSKTQILILLIIGLSTLACSPAKVPSNNSSLSSRDIPTTNGSRATVHGLLAKCNGFNDDGIQGYLSEYSTPLIGVTEYDKIRLKFSSLPSEITSSNNYRLELKLWHEKVEGNPVNASSATQFLVTHKATNYYVAKNSNGKYYYTTDATQATKFNSFSKSMSDAIVSGIEETYNGFYNLDLNEFYTQHQFTMINVSESYQAVGIIVYENSTGSPVKHSAALLPPYLAHPDAFAINHPAESLQSIHPNRNLKGSGMTDEDYYQETNIFCTDMLQ